MAGNTKAVGEESSDGSAALDSDLQPDGSTEQADRQGNPTRRPRQRPEIKIDSELSMMLILAEASLAGRGDIFAWQDQLVQARAGRLLPLSSSNLCVLSSEVADWRAWQPGDSERPGNWIAARPDRQVIEALRTQRAWNVIPTIRGVVGAPVWLGNGRVLCEPGHDAASGLFYAGPSYGDERRAEPKEALLAELIEPLAEFPWRLEEEDIGLASVTVALSYMFSLLCQYAIDPPFPWHLFSAQRQEAGKDLLARTLSSIALGKPVEVTPYPANDEELGKHVIGLLAEGSVRSVAWDEPGKTIGGSKLRALATAAEFKDRKLGVNDRIGGPNTIVWSVRGNQLRVGDDMARRCVACGLGVKKRLHYQIPDLLDWVEAHRPRLLGAAFELLRRWEEAGAPGPHAAPLSSFEPWSRTIEGLLDWLAMPTMRSSTCLLDDAQREDTEAILEAVETGCRWKGTPDVSVTELRGLQNSPHRDAWDRAFDGCAGTKSLGQRLRACQPLKDGRGLKRDGKTKRWRVVLMN